MTKHEFLCELTRQLHGLPPEDIDRSLQFYGEMIDDRMDCGVTEEEAVSALGPIQEIAAQIVGETPLTALVKTKAQKTRRLTAMEIILLILGFPLWFSLLVTVLAVIFSVYAVLWSVVASLYAVVLALGIAGIAGIFGSLILFFSGSGFPGAMLCGGGLVCVGLGILLFFGTTYTAKGVIWLGRKILVGIKRLVVGRR